MSKGGRWKEGGRKEVEMVVLQQDNESPHLQTEDVWRQERKGDAKEYKGVQASAKESNQLHSYDPL